MNSALLDELAAESTVDPLAHHTWQLSQTMSRKGRRRATIGHLMPGISTQPGRASVRIAIDATLDRAQALDIGQRMIGLSEALQDFDEPVKVYASKLYGTRTLNNEYLGTFYAVGGHKGEPQTGIYCDIDNEFSPKTVRLLGAYLIRLGSQIVDA